MFKKKPLGYLISVKEFPKEEAYTVFYKDGNRKKYMTIGMAYNRKILLNPIFLRMATLEEICAVISHEYLHLLLEYQFSRKVSLALDNISPSTRYAYTECGGL